MKDVVVVETVGVDESTAVLESPCSLCSPIGFQLYLGVRSSFPSMVSDPLVVGSLRDPS